MLKNAAIMSKGVRPAEKNIIVTIEKESEQIMVYTALKNGKKRCVKKTKFFCRNAKKNVRVTLPAITVSWGKPFAVSDRAPDRFFVLLFLSSTRLLHSLTRFHEYHSF